MVSILFILNNLIQVAIRESLPHHTEPSLERGEQDLILHHPELEVQLRPVIITTRNETLKTMMGGKQLCSVAEEPETQKGEGLHMQLERVMGGQNSWTLKQKLLWARLHQPISVRSALMAYPLSSSNHSPQFLRGF